MAKSSFRGRGRKRWNNTNKRRGSAGPTKISKGGKRGRSGRD